MFPPLGAIDVRGKKIRADPTNPRLLEIRDSGRTWELVAESAAERDQWMESLDRMSKCHVPVLDADVYPNRYMHLQTLTGWVQVQDDVAVAA